MRKNKDAFGGVLQLPVINAGMSKEQYQSSKKVLDNIEDYVGKLMKGMMTRNNYIQKQLKCFDEGYRQSNTTTNQENPENDQKKKYDQISTVLVTV